jgi:hypothetical protein
MSKLYHFLAPSQILQTNKLERLTPWEYIHTGLKFKSKAKSLESATSEH